MAWGSLGLGNVISLTTKDDAQLRRQFSCDSAADLVKGWPKLNYLYC